jgi:uridine kinase
VIDIENIQYSMRNETQFVLRCEEVFHDKISAAAATILSGKKERPFVALTGPSGSGKTTTAMRLKEYLENLGAPAILVSMDNFFLDMDKRPAEAQDDWENPLCVNATRLADCLAELAEGKLVDVPWYDFKAGRTGGTVKVQGDSDAVIIAEGIHMLNPLLLDPLHGRAIGVYVAPRTRIITSDDRIVKPEQVRVARRLIRDLNTRGHSLRDTVERAQSVDRGERDYIAPYKSNADVHIDTFHDYELCILAKYLREIPQFAEELSKEFMDQHGLSVLHDVVHTIPPLQTRYVPKNSLVREFVGGSCFRY